MSTALNKNAGEAFHRLIKRVRNTGAFSDIRFIRSKGFKPSEKPVVGYLAACEVEGESSQRSIMKTGEKGKSANKHTLSGAVWLYAPQGGSACQLTERAELILKAISVADSEGYVVSVTLGSAGFSKDANTLCQKILISLEFYLGEEDNFPELIIPNCQNTSVLINGVALSGVESVLCTEQTSYLPVRELLMGVVEYVPSESDYIIKLCLKSEGALPQSSGFTLTVRTPQYINSYSDCRVLKTEKSLTSPSEYRREYTLAATVKSEVNTEE